MSPRKSILFIASLAVGMLMAACFVSVYGEPKTFWIVAEKVSWLHYWYGLLLIVVVFWMGFVGTWAAYSILLWIVNRWFSATEDKSLGGGEKHSLR